MSESQSEAYAQAGVDIVAGYESVKLMKRHVARTLLEGMQEEIGGFGGAFPLKLAEGFSAMEEPVLVSGTDGVGTKIRLAQLSGILNTIGIDCVAMCANDIVCVGAKPLFFLDYIACGKNHPEKIASIVEGVAEGCVQAGCALIGGETAEHPGLMAEDDFDVAGFCVGIVDKKKMLEPGRVTDGDVIVALPSTGPHSNGFSLIRKVVDIETEDLSKPLAELEGKTLTEELLAPTKIYVKPILELLDAVDVYAIAHITGGGFYENIPRALPEGCTALIEKSAVKIPPIFSYLQKRGNSSEHDMFNTFNMGVGMIALLPADQKEKALETLERSGIDAYVLGVVKCTSEVDPALPADEKRIKFC